MQDEVAVASRAFRYSDACPQQSCNVQFSCDLVATFHQELAAFGCGSLQTAAVRLATPSHLPLVSREGRRMVVIVAIIVHIVPHSSIQIP